MPTDPRAERRDRPYHGAPARAMLTADEDRGLLAGVEAGGTKFVCGVGRTPDEILRTEVVETITPRETLQGVLRFLTAVQAEHGRIGAIGVASFGPLDVDPQSPGFGSFKGTPKPGWGGFNLRGALADVFECPLRLDTDVTGAGLAEATLGAGRSLRSMAYVTVGTGIGGALIVDGRPLHQVQHPEMGHIAVRRRLGDSFAGICPFHGDCLEGLASGPAVVARFGAPLCELGPGSPAWALLADYLAQLCLSLVLIAAPSRIVIGGGVMSNRELYPAIRSEVIRQNGGYSSLITDHETLDDFIAPPRLGEDAGLIGALLMADAASRGG